MKYEINKAYSFPVKGYHYDDENRLFFDLIIQEESFPVLGYDIQLHSGCPDSLTCRLLYDANREVYIKQDENSIFPLLYKEDRRYIFEVTKLLPDNSCAVTDKYGISHIYQKPDNIELVTNEIFVSYVRINKCKDDTINLEFCQENANNLSLTNKDEDTIIENIIDNNNSDVFPIEIVPFIDTREVTNREVSLFEDKAAKPIGEKDFLDNNNKTKKNSQAEIAISEKEKIQDFAYIINLDNEETLYEYLRNNMKGTNVKLIQTEIIKYIESGMQGHNYWELVLKLSRFNAHLVVATINAANKNKIDDIKDIDSNYVTPIVNALMTATDKLYHAISILMPIKNSLKSDDINILLTKSSGANTPLVFHDMFKLTELDSDAAVSYLRSNSSNIAASFALYEFFISAKNRGMIRANTPIKMFKPSQIRSIIALMKNENTFNKLLAPIMENALFNTNNQYDKKFAYAIKQNGFLGAQAALASMNRKIKEKEFAKTINIGEEYIFDYIKKLDNHYLLRHRDTGYFALMQIDLTNSIPRIQNPVRALVYRHDSKKKIFYISQRINKSNMLPIINTTSSIIIGFTQVGVNWIPQAQVYPKFITFKVQNMNQVVDFRQKYTANVISQINEYTYLVRLKV